MKIRVNAKMVDVRVVAVIRHAPDHLEVGVAGGEGYWPDERRRGRRGGPYTNLTATFRIFANTNRPDWQADHDQTQATLEAWRDEDTPLLVLDLSEPRDCILMLDEPGGRFVRFTATGKSDWGTACPRVVPQRPTGRPDMIRLRLWGMVCAMMALLVAGWLVELVGATGLLKRTMRTWRHWIASNLVVLDQSMRKHLADDA